MFARTLTVAFFGPHLTIQIVLTSRHKVGLHRSESDGYYKVAADLRVAPARPNLYVRFSGAFLVIRQAATGRLFLVLVCTVVLANAFTAIQQERPPSLR